MSISRFPPHFCAPQQPPPSLLRHLHQAFFYPRTQSPEVSMVLRMDDLHAPTVASGPSSQPTSNGTETKLSFNEIVKQKEDVEAELSALGSVLDSHGVHMNTTLTTFDGFPRADIDVAQIRTTRARIIRLKNDHKALMAKLEAAVQEQFAAGKAAEASRGASTSGTGTPSAAAIEPPFARVNTVVAGSPAEQAGLRTNDRVTRFGTVNWTNHERLSKVAQVVQQNEQRTIIVNVLRETSESAPSQALELRLTPRRDWGGRGLLGCHLVPL